MMMKHWDDNLIINEASSCMGAISNDGMINNHMVTESGVLGDLFNSYWHEMLTRSACL